MASKMAGRRRTFLNNQLGTLLILCALAAICVTAEKPVVGWLGQDARLPCDLTFTHAELVAMYWMNSSSISKVSFFRNQPRSFDDRFHLNEDFSMVIKSVVVSDEDVYSCHVELKSGHSFTNHTNLAVYAHPTTFDINQCADKKTGNKTHSLCTFKTSSTDHFDLECRVTGFRPNVTVTWTSLGIPKPPIGEPSQRKFSNGTWVKEGVIRVTAKPDKEQNYTCTVRGEATNGTDWSATITVLGPERVAHRGSTWMKIVFPLIALIVLLVIIYVIFLKDILKLKAFRNEIKHYTFRVPGASTSSIKAAHIGVYGQSGAGKSSFVNSIEFALKGKQSQPVRSAEMATGGHTTFRSRLNLTEHIAIFDRRGMRNFATSYLDDYMNEIIKGTAVGFDESASLLEEVHCPVFVYKREMAGIREAEQFLEKFAERLHGVSGYTPMVVVTHAKSLSRDDEDELKDRFSKYVSRDDIWCFENYTNTVESRQRSIQFLEFLKAALHHCEVSVVNMERQKHRKNAKPKQEKKGWISWLFGY